MTSAHYKHLRAELIITTIERLGARIGARFPDSGLRRVCAELAETARDSAALAPRLAKPSWSWRVALGALIAAGVAAQIFAAASLHLERLHADAASLVQALEAAVNLLILFGGAVWFLLTVEERVKRRRALDALHQLRALAHVIDMHQLTKDPTTILAPHQRTAASPARAMSEFELMRYLDYCAEMLALIGKLAALYADRMRDTVVIDAVNELESLTTNLARKIWQKIMIVSAQGAQAPQEGSS
jgi:hypothetical protein